SDRHRIPLRHRTEPAWPPAGARAGRDAQARAAGGSPAAGRWRPRAIGSRQFARDNNRTALGNRSHPPAPATADQGAHGPIQDEWDTGRVPADRDARRFQHRPARYTNTLFFDPSGQKILEVAAVLDVMAFLTIRKLLKVKS